MGEVSVKVRVQPADSFGLTGTRRSALDLNSAATGFARLNWTRAFDFNADGHPRPPAQPRRRPADPGGLPIDTVSSLQLRVVGTVSGNSAPSPTAPPAWPTCC